MTSHLRAQLTTVETPHGVVELDMSSPHLVRARAGHVEQRAPLSLNDRGYRVDMAFGWHVPTSRFGLVAENGPMVWKTDADPAPASDWRAIARDVATAVEAYLDSNPQMTTAARDAAQRDALGLDRPGMNPALVEMRRSLLGIVAA